MLDASQGIHPLESIGSRMFCVALATNDSANIHSVAIATQSDERFEVQGINLLAIFKPSLCDALCHNSWLFDSGGGPGFFLHRERRIETLRRGRRTRLPLLEGNLGGKFRDRNQTNSKTDRVLI